MISLRILLEFVIFVNSFKTWGQTYKTFFAPKCVK
jgi:hypothetical protein